MQPTPINPPGPCYTIPVGSSVRLRKQQDLQHGWRAHRTRRRLDFHEVFSFHGPELLVFLVEGWLVAIPSARTLHRRARVIHALAFDIERAGRQLIAWPDRHGRSQSARPRRRRDTLLDVQAGHELRHFDRRSGSGSQELIVARVRLYRTNRAVQNGAVIVSGRHWLEGNDPQPNEDCRKP